MGKVSFPPVSVMYHAAATTLQNSSPKFRNFVWYCTWTRPYHILQQILLNYNKKKRPSSCRYFSGKTVLLVSWLVWFMNTESWKYISGKTKCKCFNLNCAS